MISVNIYGNNVSIYQGLNMSWIAYNDNDISEVINISPLIRYNFGIETKSKNSIFGASINQRGYRYEISGGDINNSDWSFKPYSPFEALALPMEIYNSLFSSITNKNTNGYEVFNILSLHYLYIIEAGIDDNFFGGVQIGLPISGKSSVRKSKLFLSDYNDYDIDVGNMNFNAGLLFGMNVYFNKIYGLRLSYFQGVTDFIKDIPKSNNYKNRTFNVSIIFAVNPQTLKGDY